MLSFKIDLKKFVVVAIVSKDVHLALSCQKFPESSLQCVPESSPALCRGVPYAVGTLCRGTTVLSGANRWRSSCHGQCVGHHHIVFARRQRFWSWTQGMPWFLVLLKSRRRRTHRLRRQNCRRCLPYPPVVCRSPLSQLCPWAWWTRGGVLKRFGHRYVQRLRGKHGRAAAALVFLAFPIKDGCCGRGGRG